MDLEIPTEASEVPKYRVRGVHFNVSTLLSSVPRYVCLLWATGVRKAPKLKPGALKVLLPIGFAHALGHAGAVIALGAGAVSFAQTVKAAEPLFTCLLSFVFLGTTFKSTAGQIGSS